LFGKSDPFFEVSKYIHAAGGSNAWQVVYRSEVIQNNLNPTWKSVQISFDDLCHSNHDESIRITVKDWEKSGKHTPMGHFETTVNEMIIMSTNNNNNNNNNKTTGGYTLKRGVKQFGQILVVNASAITTTTTTTTTTEAPADTAPPPAVAAPSATATTTAAAATVVPLPPPPPPEEQPPTSPTKFGISTVGLVPMAPPLAVPPTTTTTTTTTTTRPTFLDYLSGGLELQLSVAIDFTGSNGDPRQPGTLHYIDRYRRQLNDYEKALTAVGSIVAKYDHDQQFPVMGFGAKYNGQIQHCFQLGGHNKEVHGVQGMLEAYRSTFATGLTMSGPTVFSQVIDVAASQARRDQQQQQQQQLQQQQQQQRYHILLILTDGAVSDVMRTKQAIAEASTAPLSIVIVGIGQADFGTMQFLDDFADSNNNGIRDICQFVEFRKFAHNKSGLTEATLEEIPDQVVDYFQSNNIPPLPPPPPVSQLLVPEPDDWNDDDEEEEDDEIIPLDLNFHEDGEITLGSGGVYDDTDYNNTMYAGITPMVPPSAPNPTAPIAPTVPYAPPPQQQQQQPYSIPAQPPPPQQQQQPMYTTAPQQQTTASYYYYPQQQPQSYSFPPPPPPPVQATAAKQPAVFHVQVPPGVVPGQQLQIQHPQNGQAMIVVVSHGVPAGGTFAVAY